jgi:hypothetical protein
MCFYDFAAFCAAQNCAMMESGLAVLLLFFSVLRNTLYFRANLNAVFSVVFHLSFSFLVFRSSFFRSSSSRQIGMNARERDIKESISYGNMKEHIQSRVSQSRRSEP